MSSNIKWDRIRGKSNKTFVMFGDYEGMLISHRPDFIEFNLSRAGVSIYAGTATGSMANEYNLIMVSFKKEVEKDILKEIENQAHELLE